VRPRAHANRGPVRRRGRQEPQPARSQVLRHRGRHPRTHRQGDAPLGVIIALARFGGLRSPPEVLSLKWEDVALPRGRIVVDSPKAEHIEGKASRVVPIFARLRPYLEEAWELAGPGEVYVIGGA
jgi:integrase